MLSRCTPKPFPFVVPCGVLACTTFALTATTVQLDTAPRLRATVIAESLTQPVVIASAPGDRSRLFVGELGVGQNQVPANVRIIDLANGTLLAGPFLTAQVDVGVDRGRIAGSGV